MGASGVPHEAGLLVLQVVGVVARAAQQFLTANQFAVHGVVHAGHQGRLVGEVGDDGGGVRQVFQAEEGGAALEVHEDEVEDLGRVGEGERGDQRAQQFALS